jgi:hypothetical protein
MCGSFLRRASAVLGFDKFGEAHAHERARNPKNWYGHQWITWSILDGMICLTRRETEPFYKSKGSVYNVWFTGAATPYSWTKIMLEGSQA